VAVVTPAGRSVSPAMPDGFPDERQLAATTRDGRVRQVDVVLGGDQYTVRTAKVGDRVTQAVLDRHEGEEERGRILTALLTAGSVGVLLAALVAAWMARRTVRPMADTIAMQRRFVADASHELRTPLTLLSTRAQLLARRVHSDPGPSGQLVSDLDGVLADTKVLTEILDDLLVAADTRTVAKEPLDLVRIAEQCIAAAGASADEDGVALVLSTSSTTALVEGSPASLRRAVTALVDNAVDHAASEVRVTVGQVGREVVLTVSDDGPGVPSEEAPRLFERFTSSRAEGPVPRGRRHYGLGLALVADVAAAHDGQVSAGARQDGSPGARFTLTLPALAAGPRHLRHPR
jgi:two-component system, OmpR family, sensor kinase